MVEGISEEMVYLMTDRERAKVVIQECPEVWDRQVTREILHRIYMTLLQLRPKEMP